MKKLSKSSLFLLTTFTLSYLLAAALWLSGQNLTSVLGLTISIIYMFIPTLAVLFVSKIVYKEPIKESCGIRFKFNKWFVVAWLLMPIITFATIGISILLPDVVLAPDMAGMLERFKDTLSPERFAQIQQSMNALPINPIWLILIQGMFAGITVNAIAAFGEELGWRGFLLREFKRMSFAKASLLIGLIWGVWHMPLILMGHNYPQHPVIGVFMMTAWCMLLTPIFLYIRLKSKSVIAAAILHGTLNGTAGLAIMFIKGGNDITTGVTGLPGFIVLGIVILLLFIWDKCILKERLMWNRIEDAMEK